jgi:hypothetical protein
LSVNEVAAVSNGWLQTSEPSAGSVATLTRYLAAPGTTLQLSSRASLGYVIVAPSVGLRSDGCAVQARSNERTSDQAPRAPVPVTPRTRQ